MSKSVKKSPSKLSMTMNTHNQSTLPSLIAVVLPKIELSLPQISPISIKGSRAEEEKGNSKVREGFSAVMRDKHLGKTHSIFTKKEMSASSEKQKKSKLKNKNAVNVARNVQSINIPFNNITTRSSVQLKTNKTVANHRHNLFDGQSPEVSKPILIPERIQRYFISQGIIYDERTLTDMSVNMLLNGKLELSAITNESTLNSLQSDKFFKLVSESNSKVIKAVLERIKRIIKEAESLEKDKESILLGKLKEDVNKKILMKDNIYLMTAFACIKQLLSEFDEVPKEKIDLLMKSFYRLFEENDGCWKRLFSVLADAIGNLELRVSVLETVMKSENIKIFESSVLTDEQKNFLKCLQQEKIKLEEELNNLKRDANLCIIHWDKIKDSERIVNKLKALTETAMEKLCDLDGKLDEDKRALKLNIERLIQAYPGDFLSERSSSEGKEEVKRIKILEEVKSVMYEKEEKNHKVLTKDAIIQAEVKKSSEERELESFIKNGSRVKLFIKDIELL